MALRETNVPTAGAAKEAIIAKMAIVTINSMSVKPLNGKLLDFMFPIVTLKMRNRLPPVGQSRPPIPPIGMNQKGL